MQQPDLAELAERFLPSYLLPNARAELLKHLTEFPHNRGYYSIAPAQEQLQGDGFTNFVIFNFHTAERKSVKGLVLSNSCDIAAPNTTVEDQRITFAPIISVQKYADLLRASGRDQERIESTLGRMRKQHLNNVFYLPPYGEFPESLVLFDDLHSEPLSYFWSASKQRLLRLSDFGFWLLVLKLSIHFTRLHEEVQRDIQHDE